MKRNRRDIRIGNYKRQRGRSVRYSKASELKDEGSSHNVTEKNELNNIQIHPLLQPLAAQGSSGLSSTDNDIVPKKLKNPLRPSNWKLKSGFLLNPYIDQNDISLEPERRKALGTINEPGKYIKQAEEWREEVREKEKERERERKLKKLNLIPNESKGEQYYTPQMPPRVEWWDESLLDGKSYETAISDLVNMRYKDPMNEDNPITIYIQHPVPIPAPWERENMVGAMPIYLTKKEQKRLRRNERLKKLRDERDKIKLGLKPAPPPKIKLKNLVNVLTNETIKNPTEVEQRIRREMAERKLQHERTNEERALTKEQKAEKFKNRLATDRQSGIYSCVFRISRLVSPRNKYKVDINAKEWELVGICLNKVGGMSIVVVEGGCKAVSKYKKLMLRRIKWTENERSKRPKRSVDSPPQEDSRDETEEPLEDLSGNKCELMWEGELSDYHFRKWSMYNVDNDERAMETMARFHLENYWIQAKELSVSKGSQ